MIENLINVLERLYKEKSDLENILDSPELEEDDFEMLEEKIWEIGEVINSFEYVIDYIKDNPAI